MMETIASILEHDKHQNRYGAVSNSSTSKMTGICDNAMSGSYQGSTAGSVECPSDKHTSSSSDIDLDFLDAYEDSIYTGKFFNTKQDHRDALLCNLYTQVEFLKTELLEKNFLIRTLVVRENEFERDLRAHTRRCNCKTNYESDEGIGTVSSSPTESLKKIARSIDSISSSERNTPFHNVNENPFNSLVSTRAGSLHGSIDSIKSVVESYSTLCTNDDDGASDESTMFVAKKKNDDNSSHSNSFSDAPEPFMSIGDLIDCEKENNNTALFETTHGYTSPSITDESAEKFDSSYSICGHSTMSVSQPTLGSAKILNSSEDTTSSLITDCPEENDGDDTLTTIPSSFIETESKEQLNSFMTDSKDDTMMSLDVTAFTTMSNESTFSHLEETSINLKDKNAEVLTSGMTHEAKESDSVEFLPSMTSETTTDVKEEPHGANDKDSSPRDFITVVRKKKEKQHRNHRIKQMEDQKNKNTETVITENLSYANTVKKEKIVETDKRRLGKQMQKPTTKQQQQQQQQPQQQQQQTNLEQQNHQEQQNKQEEQEKDSKTNYGDQNSARAVNKKQPKRLLSIKRRDSQKPNKQGDNKETSKPNKYEGARSPGMRRKGLNSDDQNTYLNIYPERDKFAKGFSYSDIASKGIGSVRGR